MKRRKIHEIKRDVSLIQKEINHLFFKQLLEKNKLRTNDKHFIKEIFHLGGKEMSLSRVNNLCCKSDSYINNDEFSAFKKGLNLTLKLINNWNNRSIIAKYGDS